MLKSKFVFCFFLALFFVFPKAFAVSPKLDFLLTVEGTGTTVEEARKNALINLSQSIYTKVEGVFENKDVVQDNKVTSYSSNQSKLATIGYFAGVAISSAKKVKVNNQELYSVNAAMSVVAYKATIDNVYSGLRQQNIDTLSDYDLLLELEQARFLRALFYFGSSKKIDYKPDVYRSTTSYIRDLEYRTSMAAKVIFKVTPEDSTASVTIDGEKYKVNERIFLPEGSFRYTVTSDKYSSVSGNFEVFFQDSIVIDIAMQAKLIENAKVNLELNVDKTVGNLRFFDEEKFANIFANNLRALQITLDSESKSILKIDISSPIKGSIAGIEFTTLPVYLFLKNARGNTLLAKELKLDNVLTEQGINYNKLLEAIEKELNQALAGEKIKELTKTRY